MRWSVAMGFIKAPPGAMTRYLWVGGVHGMSVRQLSELFAPYGNPAVVLPAHDPSAPPSPDPAAADAADALPSPSAASQRLSGFHAFLSFDCEGDAAAAVAAVPRNAPWPAAGGRKIVLHFADVRRDKRPVPRPVSTCASELGVPGLVLLEDFVTEEEEKALLVEVLETKWTAAAADGNGATAATVTTSPASCPRLCPLELLPDTATAPEEAAGGGVGGEGEGKGEGGGAAVPCAVGVAADNGDGGGGAGHWEMMAKRRVQHYGYRFDYATRNVDPAKPLGPLPPWATALANRIAALPEVSQPLDQLTVNEYDPGVGLAPHVDTHSAFTGPIISLSLGSSAVMEMRRGDVARPLLLPPRSLLVMGGESRYAWQHYIPHRVADLVGSRLLPRSRRVSLTFRKVRGYPCQCDYPACCDSQQANLPPTRISQLQLQQSRHMHQQHGQGEGESEGQSEGQQQTPPAPAPAPPRQHQYQQLGHRMAPADHTAAPLTHGSLPGEAVPNGAGGGASRRSSATGGGGVKGKDERKEGWEAEDKEEEEEEARLAALEAEHVHKVYDAIAPHFSATRFAIWPKVRAFIESLPRGGVVADVGCGNGKYFGVRRDLAVLGSDISAGLAEVAAQRLHPPGLPPSASPPAADALVADALRLPYRAGSCDGVLCIAVLHHLSSRRRRVRLLRQLLRVLRPAASAGGRALVTVWATEQEEPAKTTAKWTRIPAPDGSGGGGGRGGGNDDSRITDRSPASGGSGSAEEEKDGGVGWDRGNTSLEG
ncbi:hypothetical protein Vretifemale_9845, partial [Volvox reticuliferus]